MDIQCIQRDLKKLAAVVFKVPIETLTDDVAVGMIEAWDSMGHLELFMAIESQWKIKFTAQEIVSLSSLGMIVESIYHKTRT